MWPNLQEIADLVTFTKEIYNGKLHFLCSDDIDTHTSLIFPYSNEMSFCNIFDNNYIH